MPDSLITSSNFWQETFGISTEIAFQTIFPTVITISIFILGIGITRYQRRAEAKKRSEAIIEYTLAQIDVLIKAVTNQIENITEFVSKLREDKVQSLEFQFTTSFNTNHIRMVKSNNLFDIYVVGSKKKRKKRLPLFNSLILQLDLIDGLANSFKESFNYTFDHIRKYEDLWNNDFEKICDAHDNWLTSLTDRNIDPNSDPFLQDFFTIYHTWVNTENRVDIYVAVDILINPALEKAKEHQPNLYGEALFRPLLRCLAAYNNHKHLRNMKIEEFEKYKTQMTTIIEKLEEFRLASF